MKIDTRFALILLFNLITMMAALSIHWQLRKQSERLDKLNSRLTTQEILCAKSREAHGHR